MKPIRTLVAGIAVFLGVSASQNTAAADETTISGTFTYRERILLPPDARGIVVLQDVSRADVAAVSLAEQVLDLSGKSPPFSYSLSVSGDDLTETGRYAVRVQIRAQNDNLLWTSDTVHRVEPSGENQTLDPITLVQIDGQAGDNPDQTFYGIDWQVVSVDGLERPGNAVSFIGFEQDGGVSGRAGCNGFTGSFEQSDGAISLGPLAMTRRACVPEIGEFEARFSSVFAGTLRVDMGADMLVLTDNEGRQIVSVYEN